MHAKRCLDAFGDDHGIHDVAQPHTAALKAAECALAWLHRRFAGTVRQEEDDMHALQLFPVCAEDRRDQRRQMHLDVGVPHTRMETQAT